MNNLNDRINKIIELRELGRSTEDRNLLKQALQEFESLLKEGEQQALINYQIGICYDNLGYTRNAIPFYEVAIENNLEKVHLKRCLLGLGSSYRLTGNYEKSLKVLQTGYEMFPEYKPLHLFYVLTLFNLNEYERALEIGFETLLSVNENEDVAFFSKGLDYYSKHINDIWTPPLYEDEN